MNKHLSSYFDDFLSKIRPEDEETSAYKEAHKTLRERLTADATLKPIIVNTFLQGSYRRATAIRPEGENRSDIDVVVVTRLSETEYSPPTKAMEVFRSFLDTHYKGDWEFHDRSINIALDEVELDLVVTSAPSEIQEGILKSESVSTDRSIEEASDWWLGGAWIPIEKRQSRYERDYLRAADQAKWKVDPLRIPDRAAKEWRDTHPLEQIRWTQDKNGLCAGHYVNVVKALKWWRRLRHTTPKYPKGYPVEHLIGDCCPDTITSIAEGVVLTLEAIESKYQSYADAGTVPFLADHGVTEHDVFKRISGEEFAAFHKQICTAADVARAAFDEDDDLVAKAEGWQKLFGDKFPSPEPGEGGDRGGPGGFTKRTTPTLIGSGRFG